MARLQGILNMTTNSPTNSTPNSTSKFTEVEHLRDPDGIIAVITERASDGRVSFMLAREFEREGVTQRSAYMARRHIAAARRLLNDLEDRLELAEDRARAKKRAS